MSKIPTNGRTVTVPLAKTGIPTTKWSLHAQWAPGFTSLIIVNHIRPKT
jgi:hypothetical protein